MQEKNKMSEDMASRLSSLTERELKYFRAMFPKSGVLYLTSKPGVAKSSISAGIAKKMGYKYMDIRLSMVDETDVGLYPNVSTIDVDGSPIKCLDFVVPRWAVEANKQPTLIHFEELNRAQLPVRNAALQILLERQIGVDFKFNDNVLMMSSGNLGDEDGTDVEEFDNALNNRLIHYRHSITADEWIRDFARDRCHPIIISYIKSYPEKLEQKPNDNHKAFATPRTWTFLSDYLISNFGKDSKLEEFISYLTPEVVGAYIGNGCTHFIKFCKELYEVNINDILNRYDQVVEILNTKYNRDKNSELVVSLKSIDLEKLNDEQLNNAKKFLDRLGDDELTAYLLFVVDNVDISERIRIWLKSFKRVFESIVILNDCKN